jgi:phenylalanyl-tRNA synthetase beta chain
MKISLKWLNEFVDIKEYLVRPEPLAEILTKAGLEVEDIQNRSQDFKNVVVGLILKKEMHPNADRLSLCQVSTGESVVHQIVCGAQNHKENDKVVLALPGAVLPGNFEIKKAVVRGIESGGMLCSNKELGLSSESEGILILPAETKVGQSFSTAMGLDDVTMELKVTPNRADCLSHFGLAREISCLLNKPLNQVSPKFETKAKSVQHRIQVSNQNTEAAPRYCGRTVTNVRVGPSPAWLKSRLEAIGLKSINNVVDVTNYVMMELGQPMHAFDSAQLQQGQIVIADAKESKEFTTLDGTKLVLSGNELMIRDGVRNVAMAGVIGGQNSGVQDSTTEVFLESAYFKASAVRRASRKHGIATDSAYRFTRGVDPESTRMALDRATELLVQVAQGEADAELVDIYPVPVKKEKIPITLQLVTDALGFPCQREEFNDWMKRLGCLVEGSMEGEFFVTPPAYRFDLEIPMDLVEEYARLHGYDQIPENFPPLKQSPDKSEGAWELQKNIARILTGQGFSQAMNFAFVGEKSEIQFIENLESLALMGLGTSPSAIKLRNPLSDDLNVLRRTLSLGLFKNCVHNFHQGHDPGALFEMGPVFSHQTPSQYKEDQRVAAIVWGQPQSLWEKTQSSEGLFSLKSAIEALFQNLNVEDYRFQQPENRGEIPQFLHRGQAAKIVVHNTPVGFFGSLHPKLLEAEKIRVPVALMEMDLGAFKNALKEFQHYKRFSRFPKVTRDLSLLMSSQLPANQVLQEMKTAAGDLLIDAEVFDVFSNDSLGKGFRSVSFRFVFQDKNGTLQETLVQDRMNKILDSVKQKWGLTPR